MRPSGDKEETVSPAAGTTADIDRGLERDLALCRSFLYGALSLGFLAPTERTRQRLGASDAAAALGAAAGLIDHSRGTSLEARARALALLPGEDTLESLGDRHLALFGHTARGPVPPYETEYGDDTLFQKPQEMADIAGFLRAFGLVVSPDRHERLDHVSCELEFLALLARKEAHAVETGDDAMAAETRKAARLFLKDHLARFLPSFARRLLRADEAGFYGRLARLGLEFVADECLRLGASAGPGTLRLRLPIDDGAPMACGTGEGCGPDACPPAGGGETP